MSFQFSSDLERLFFAAITDLRSSGVNSSRMLAELRADMMKETTEDFYEMSLINLLVLFESLQ